MTSLFICNYSHYTIPDQKFSLRHEEEINNKINIVSALKIKLKEINSIYLISSIAWMNKFDIIEIQIS